MSRRTKIGSVKANFAMNFILTISGILFPLITFPYASRILLADGTGKVAFATSIATYFTMLGMLGVPTYGIRACAQAREDKERLSRTVQELLVINAIMMSISLSIYILAINVIPKLSENRELFILNSVVLILNVVGCDWLYKGLEQYNYITKQSLLFKIMAIILMFILVNDRADYVNYAAVTIIASVGSYFLNFIRLREFISIQPWKSLNIKKHLKPTLTFFMMTVATTIYTSLDSVMLGFMLDDKTVGLYNAAMNLKNVLVSLVTSLGVVLLPRLSVYIKQNKTEEFKALTEKALNFVIFSSIPLTLFFIIFAEQAIYFLSGETFSGAIVPLKISMPTLIFIGMSNLFGIQMLVPMNKEYIVVKSVIAGAVINLILNCLLIPIYGANGAAIGTLVAEFIVTLYQGYYLKNLLLKQIPHLQLPKFIVAAVVGIFFVSLVAEKMQIMSYFLQLLLFSLMYAVLYVCLLALLKEKNITYLVALLKNNGFSDRRRK